MKHVIRGVGLVPSVLLLSLAAGSWSPAAAQTPKVALSGGYQYTRVPDLNLVAGWFAEVATNQGGGLGWVGEASSSQHTESVPVSRTQRVNVKATLSTFLGGVRLSGRAESRVRPFVHALAGAARLSAGAGVPTTTANVNVTDTKFALQEGGGIDLMATQRVSVRLAADVRRIFTSADEGGGENEFRVTTGVVFALGR